MTLGVKPKALAIMEWAAKLNKNNVVKLAFTTLSM